MDSGTGRTLEDAPDTDLDSGQILAFASQAMFRQTGVNPTKFPMGDRAYINADGQELHLPV